MHHITIPRRRFLKSATLASAAAVAFPHLLHSQGSPSSSNKLNVACIGVGGRGYDVVQGVKNENLIAFCDVDDTRAAKTFDKFPTVPRFRDYRKMLDRLGNKIDAVTISTPDHMHYPIAVAALSLGKHVYVEKPLTHTIWEARQLAKLAMITYQFPARGAMPPVKWTWYDGGLRPLPPADFESDRRLPEQGSLIVGSKATVLSGSHYQTIRIVPERKMKELAPTFPRKTLPRVEGGNHFADWLRACKGGGEAGSNFAYSTRLTEVCLLSNLAIRVGRPLVWDHAAMKVVNEPEANHLLTKQYRPGFGV